jgi:hypothetical protein
VVAVAWFVGTFVPFVLLSLIWKRTSYLYYMVIVMPGLYAAAAWLVARFANRMKLIGVWVVLLVAALVLTYPLTPLP